LALRSWLSRTQTASLLPPGFASALSTWSVSPSPSMSWSPRANPETRLKVLSPPTEKWSQGVPIGRSGPTPQEKTKPMVGISP
jgi:hypothetical protein